MQRLEVSGAVRPLQWSLGVKGLIHQPPLPRQDKAETRVLRPFEVCLVGTFQTVHISTEGKQRTGRLCCLSTGDRNFVTPKP